MINVLFAAGSANWDEFGAPLKTAFADTGLSIQLSQDISPEETDYIVYAPACDLRDFTPYTKCKAVLSLWAGVDKIASNQTMTQPLCRMVDPGLTQSMVEWVTGHVLRYHLGMDAHINGQNGHWIPVDPPLARDRKVTVLGLGQLGTVCATTLAGLGFDVTGWSRKPKSIDGITCHAGDRGLQHALTSAEIIVLLLPNTPSTANILNAQTLALLPKGACILNPGRGTLIDDDALLAALDAGQVGHATLDVFRVEPLPAEHPYWAHPNVTVTPHIAAATRPATASEVIAQNIARHEAGQPLHHLVDRVQGY